MFPHSAALVAGTLIPVPLYRYPYTGTGRWEFSHRSNCDGFKKFQIPHKEDFNKVVRWPKEVYNKTVPLIPKRGDGDGDGDGCDGLVFT